MNKLKTGSIAFFSICAVAISSAQSVDQAKKAIDAEQYEKAKNQLKSIVSTKPQDGKAAFLLGNIYLKQELQDSAKIYFQKGLSASDDSKLNYIGLGQIDLNAGNVAAAREKFSQALSDVRRKEVEPYIYVAQAYMNSDKPDYKNALSVLEKAVATKSQDPLVQLALGDAHYGNKDQNAAYVAYRNAYSADNTLLRAKMQQGVLLKGARSFNEAVRLFNDVIALDPNYGPVYRELAETYYLWAISDAKNYDKNIKIALGHYEKYMTLTDYSLTSRMRHADFLILAKDYKALEVEAEKMRQIDKVNPRILRYLGYSAYENGNTDVAIQSLQDFIANPANKVIARDYIYLGLAKLRKAEPTADEETDSNLFESGLADIRKAVELDIEMTNDLSELGRKLYEDKKFKEAAAVYEIAVTNPKSLNHLLDNFYLGNSIYFANTARDVETPNAEQLKKADEAFGKVIAASPTTQDVYLYRARTNRLLENMEMETKYYEQYIDVVTQKGAEEVAANKARFIEAYNNIGSNYANSDVVKAKEYFNKTLQLDPQNEFAASALKQL
ncbi:MAG: tetratricopeptide repeat protein [Flavobacterium sp.]|nr:tetratricopeptide repeat protein [Flavobacterium sp.]